VREYEIMLILPADTEDSGVDGVIGRISAILADKGGELGKIDRWGRKRLAYEIARQSEGYYVVVEFTAAPGALKELDRVLSLSDDILRFKVVVRAERAPRSKWPSPGPSPSASTPSPAERTAGSR